MAARAAVVLAALCVLACAPALAGDLTGPAQAKDGDSLLMGGRELRLAGIDAPEWSATRPAFRQSCEDERGQAWTCGAAARAVLESLVAGRIVTCADTGMRSYRRPVVRCFVDGRDLAEAMASGGWSAPHPDWPGPYDAAMAEAKAAGRGIWRGAFTPPWAWRKAQFAR